MGINVVTAQQAKDFTTGHSVLDPSKIAQMSSSRITLNENRYYTYSTSNIEDLLVKFNFKFGLDSEAGVFVASLKNNLNLAGSFNYQNYSYKHFSILEHKITRYRLYLDNYSNPATYENCFSSEYLADLNNLKINKNYDAFFAKYGTHVVGSAIYGGKLYATYSLVSNKFILNADVESLISNAVSFNELDSQTYINVAESLNSGAGTKYSHNDLSYGFYVNAVGGNAFSGGIINSFNTGYDSWVNSFNTSDDNSVIIDYNDGGLVPLWDILPSQYSSLSDEMLAAFKTYYHNNVKNVIQEFKTANYKEFNGGSGSVDDPFLITNEQQLTSIKDVSMNANYKLSNSITLSNKDWTPIGGFYKENRFEGTLDGGGYSIKNLSRSSDIPEKNNRFYFGLFGCIGENGVVKNLTLSNCNIKLYGPKVNNANARVFIGALAGFLYGTVDNVSVYGTCLNDVCTNGMSYVGSIAGAAREARITNCNNYAAITSGRYGSAAGGFLGFSTGTTLMNCRNYGQVSARGTAWGGHASAAGIVGEIYNGTNPSLPTNIISCYNYVTPKATDYGGGLVCKKKVGDMYALTQSYILE